MKNKKQTYTTTPVITILSTKENEDGSMSVEFEYDQNWMDLVKLDLKKKKITKKDIEKHFINLLTKAAEETDGYKLEKIEKIL